VRLIYYSFRDVKKLSVSSASDKETYKSNRNIVSADVKADTLF